MIDAAIDAPIDANRRALGGAAAGAAPNAPFPPAKPGGNGARSTRTAPAAARPNGAPIGAPPDVPTDAPTDAATLVARLEEAGRTLLALPHQGPSPRLRTSAWQVLSGAMEGEGAPIARVRAALPGSARISRMDEALGWIALIPPDRIVLRRIVGLRALVHPLTERHLYPWRRLGAALGADHKAVQRWHGQGIALILAGLAGAGTGSAGGMTRPLK